MTDKLSAIIWYDNFTCTILVSYFVLTEATFELLVGFNTSDNNHTENYPLDRFSRKQVKNIPSCDNN